MYYLFNIKRLTLNNKTFLIQSDYVKPVKDLYVFTTTYITGLANQLNFLDETKKSGSLSKKYKRFGSGDLAEIVDATRKFFEE
ncbi:MAG: hypothetical protein WCH65_01620 [bacterium]